MLNLSEKLQVVLIYSVLIYISKISAMYIITLVIRNIILNFVLIKIQLPNISKNQINFPTRNTNKAIQLSTFSPTENGLRKADSHKICNSVI